MPHREKPFAFLFLLFLPPLWLPRAAVADSTVVFNEIQYHPRGGDADLEWIELLNQMAVDMDISGWTLAEGVFFEFPEGTVIRGGEFLVVAASPAALEKATGFSGAMGPFDGRLDDSGETLELRNNNGRLMDSVKYGDSGNWPVEPDGSGATLAKMDPDFLSSPARNWAPSAQVGGTPGRHNFPLPRPPGGLPREVISYWSFDEPLGQFLDASGGNNGTLGSGARRVAGFIGSGAVSFDNTTNAFINVGAGVGNNFSTSSGITVEALIQPAWSGALNDNDEIFRKEDGNKRILLSFQNDGNTNGFSLPPVGPGPVLSFGLNVGGVYSELDMLLDGQADRPTLEALEDGGAHHIAATYDSASGTKAIYVDGALAFSVSLGAGKLISSGGSTAAYIGNLSGRTEPFTGAIDEVVVWKKALSPQEVSLHFDQVLAGLSYFDVPEDTPPRAPFLAFNEVFRGPGAFWVEILNHGTEAVELKDHVIKRAGGGNEEHIFSARSLAAGGYLTLGAAELGFEPLPGDKLFLYSPGRDMVLAAAKIEEGLRARRPEGTGEWLVPDRPTPGVANSFHLHSEVVLNEIMYHHRLVLGGPSPEESPESWIELYNRSASPVELSGWKIGGGIEYSFADGTVLQAGEYLVVAKDKDYLRSLYPTIRIEGNLEKRLSHKSDRITLKDENGNPADDVTYYDGGRWPKYADGGGSSLELRDPRADNSKGEAWAASDEGSKSLWKNYSYQMVATSNVGPTQWSEFVLGLLDAGEAFIDNVSVIESPSTSPRELIQNGAFVDGASHWRLLGNHGHSKVIGDPDDPLEQVLDLFATGSTEHMHNHVETTLSAGARVVNGREYKVSFAARWLGGSNQLNTRLYFNRAPRTTLLEVPAFNGTPGALNSRFESNIGPTYDALRHSPVVPQPSEPVTVSVVAEDPDGVSSLKLFYSLNEASWSSVVMSRDPEGLYQGIIPPQPAATLVHFYVEGTDGRGAKSSFPAAGPGSRALYRVNDGQARLGLVHNLRILMTPADTDFLHLVTNVMSNDRLGATVVYDEREAFYDAGVRLKGSERGRDVSGRVGFNIKLPPEHRFRGVHESIQIDRSGGWKFGGPSGQDEILVKHIAGHAGGIPSMYDDIIRIIAPRSAQNGPALLIMAAFGNVYLDSQYQDGSSGTAFELELIYYPTTTTGGPEGLKIPEPDDVLGTDIRDLGNDKEAYRWNFLIEGNRQRDDYSGLMALAKAFSLPVSTLPAGSEAVMDVDEWMRTFVLYSLCGINDAYTWGNNHNLIIYVRPEDQKALALPWDLDFSWVQPVSSPLWGDQNLARIIQLNPNRRRYYSHLLDVIDTTFNRSYMARWASHYGSLCGQDFSSITTFIDQRRAFVLRSIPAQLPFAITTNGGNDLSVDTQSAIIEGNAWFDVSSLLLDGREELLEPAWTTPTHWRISVPLDGGVNKLTFLALDRDGNFLASDTINVTSTAGPAITSVIPSKASAGEVVTLKGTGFQPGIKVFFGTVESSAVTFDQAVDPGSLSAQVPALPAGTVQLTVRNLDGRSSSPVDFIVASHLFVRGDIDVDGEVDLADVIKLLFYLYLGAAIPCEDAADSNNNELLDMSDAIRLLDFIFRGAPPPESPFPLPGPDSGSPGPLDCLRGV